MIEEPEATAGQVLEHLFRRESAKMVATLTGIFGLHNLELAEDAVQEALLKALRHWSFGTVPQNPGAWLMQVAKNQARDVLRRHKRLRLREEEIAAALEQHPLLNAHASIFAGDEMSDDQLRMIFACCHPALPRESQVALALKTLCGFSVREIGRAFLLGDETIAKRLTRARQTLTRCQAQFEIPEGKELAARLTAVHEVLYLLFNEGYNASRGSELIRHELCDEAIRLARLLEAHSATQTPATRALLALFLLQAARFSARVASEGEILLLEEQDRTSWNRQLLAEGMLLLTRAAAGDRVSQFHLEAGIAACHCAADSYAATDWLRILSLYDDLSRLNPSPVIALNRAVALAKVRGPKEALVALHEWHDHPSLKRYHLFYAVVAALQLELGDKKNARENYRQALLHTELPAEQRFVQRRLDEC